MAKSLLQRISPSSPRWRVIDWPFAVDGAAPQVAVLVLGGDAFEAVDFALQKYFRDLAKAKAEQHKTDGKKAPPAVSSVRSTDEVWQSRERAELVFRAFRELDDDGQPSDKNIAASVEEIVKLPPQMRDLLYAEWASMQSEVAPPKYGQGDLDELVEHLKKKPPSEVLGGWPSTLLIALIATLVARLKSSTEES